MIDIADRPEVAPELRLVPHAFRRMFGRPAAGVWYAPGVLNLLGGELSVCARWGAIVAGDRRDDDRLELVSINRPAESVLLPAEDVPAWAAPIAATGGATLLCSVDLPQGAGLSAANALACAAALALHDLTGAELAVPPGNVAFAGKEGHAVERSGTLRPLDLAGHRLLVIDTRIRRGAPVLTRPVCVETGDLGPALTAYHRAQQPDPEQDLVVTAALAAGARGASMLVDEPGRPVVALVAVDRLRAVRAGITAACSTTPRYLTVLPTGGALRIANRAS